MDTLQILDNMQNEQIFKQSAKFLADALRAAHCMDFDDYLEVMSHPVITVRTRLCEAKDAEYEYHFDKWKGMQKDFSKWYCYLDEGNQRKFVKWVLERRNKS